MTTFTFKEVETAFVQGDITTEQFIEILIENFGRKKTKKILEHNLRIALKKEEKSEGLP